MNDKISPELLKKFIRGEATPEESELVDKWYTSFDKTKDLPQLENEVELEARILNRIRQKIKKGDSASIEQPSTYHFFGSAVKWAASFALIGVIGVATYFLQQDKILLTTQNDSVKNPGVEKFVNNTASILQHKLSDGSVVRLQPHSTIEFPAVFSPFKRNVKLTGEAFFDVSKDKNRPFVITTGGVTIKVLGTSFNVKAYKGADEITVAVKTGRVLVTKSEKAKQETKGTEEQIILTPNQEVVYNTVNENFLRKLVDEPAIILTKPTLFEMKYDGTPVDKIFEVLEENYGIDIVFDKDILSGCTLTTSLAEEGLYERIEIICKAIGAQYEITDSMIVVKSAGCR